MIQKHTQTDRETMIQKHTQTDRETMIQKHTQTDRMTLRVVHCNLQYNTDNTLSRDTDRQTLSVTMMTYLL